MRNSEDTTQNAKCDLSELPDFRDLPESVRKALQAICRRRSYGAGQTIAETGTHLETIGIVRNGILKMQKSLPDGRQHVVGLLVAGDMFGRVFDGRMHFSVEAATNAGVCAFERTGFEALLLRTPKLDRLLVLNLMTELDRARDWMIILANPKIRGRLAGFLLLLCTRYQTIDRLITVKDRAIRIRIPLSRPDMAHLLGTRVESISRALHALADDGLVKILRPDLVEVAEIAALVGEIGEPDLGDTASLERLVDLVQKTSE
ncbi:Crp/Fnr family transcriptional regulator [Tropicimonas sp. IMCC34043]|uniref:Crp/Fnr family transcriptional regulator n=1 Tax=Tropicimonas sp. IMCC34043 TaxID=2248760 RepID=UPI000E2526FA|nr:Crp/Fnr family transcriptional regulator [Tropicimonas sp. IMCC34043]